MTLNDEDMYECLEISYSVLGKYVTRSEILQTSYLTIFRVLELKTYFYPKNRGHYPISLATFSEKFLKSVSFRDNPKQT